MSERAGGGVDDVIDLFSGKTSDSLGVVQGGDVEYREDGAVKSGHVPALRFRSGGESNGLIIKSEDTLA